MRLFRLAWHLLLLLLLLSSLVRCSSDVVCLGTRKGPLPKEGQLPPLTLVQSRALRSRFVFVGTLRSVLVQRDGTVRAWFTVDNRLKPVANATRTAHSTSRRVEDTEVVYYGRVGGGCLDQDSLRLGRQYLVFGGPSRRIAWPSMIASAAPIPKDKRTLRAVKKILCPGCARPARVAGLQKVRAQEGSRARLSCHLAGNPIPWVEWYRDGRRLTSQGRTRVKTKRRISRLVIRRVRPSDRGVYECRAGNAVQEELASTRVTLFVDDAKKKTHTTRAPPATQSSPWTTEPCPTTEYCLNGGTCIFYKDVGEYVCHCAEGYVGLRCDYKDVRISLGEIKNYSSRGDIP